MKKIIINDDHYLIGGKKYVRTTKVLDIIAKEELYRWFARYGMKYCNRHTERRASFGTKFHKYAEMLVGGKGKDVNWIAMNDEMFNTVNMFMDWAKHHELEPKHLEHHMHNDKYMYAGTADFIGWYDGKKYLIDWKTAKRIYPNYYLQLAAYVYMYEQSTNDKLDGFMIARFRDGKVETKEKDRKECDEYFQLFLAALKLWRWKHK